jgi:hypothetical protein
MCQLSVEESHNTFAAPSLHLTRLQLYQFFVPQPIRWTSRTDNFVPEILFMIASMARLEFVTAFSPWEPRLNRGSSPRDSELAKRTSDI